MGSVLRLIFGLLLPIISLILAWEVWAKDSGRIKRVLGGRKVAVGAVVLVALLTMGVSTLEFVEKRTEDLESQTRYAETVRRDSLNLIELGRLLGHTEEIGRTS